MELVSRMPAAAAAGPTPRDLFSEVSAEEDLSSVASAKEKRRTSRKSASAVTPAESATGSLTANGFWPKSAMDDAVSQ